MSRYRILGSVAVLILVCSCASDRNSPALTYIPPALASAEEALAAPAPAPAYPAPTQPMQPMQQGGDIYPLWYATNRLPNDPSDESSGYSTQRDHRIHYGKVFVKVPESFLNDIRNESWLKKLFFKSPESTLTVRNRVPMSVASFIDDVRGEIAANPPDQRLALIYIHGFRTTFDEAAQRAAGIGYQLKIPTTAFFSWPSKGATAGYEADKNSVNASSDLLASFLINFTRQSGATKVHLIAHSMGNDALLQAMFRPAMQKAIRAGLHFGQIILAAPDVDSDVFVRDAHLYTEVADRVTLYASKQDIALTLSKRLSDFPRAGLLPPPMIVPSIDTLDVSSVNLTLLGHSYVADEIAVLEDMNKLIFQDDPPIRRSRIRPGGDGAYWILQ